MSWQLFLRRAPPPPQRHQLMRRLLTLHQPHRSNETISRTAAAHVRRASVQSAPTPPPAPTAPRAPTPAAPSQPLRDTKSGAAGIELYDSSFASAFERAVEEVVSPKCDERLQGKPGPSSNSPPQLSPWLQYLVGLRSEPPRRTRLSNNNSPTQMADERRTRLFSSDISNDAWAADNVFFHHIFDNAKDATLYVTVRQPREFLKPDVTARESSVEAPKTSDYASKVKSEWSLAPFGGLLQRLERVLREMLQGELAKSHNNDLRNMSGGVWSADFVLTFWRAMLEQAFLEQYCEVEALNTAATDGNDKGGGGGDDNVESHRVLDREKCGGQKAPRTVFDLYPYDYRDQPAELRRRLEACLRALLCASAFTLHAQWEQFMVRHGPNDTVAHILGLEVILLWWYANPDQVPVELTSSVHRLPPPTLRQQARLAEGAGGGGNDAGTLNHSALWRSSMAAAGNVAAVEEHLREYMAALKKNTGHLVDASDRNTDAESPARARTRCSAGGFLCPAAVFPPSYRDALRAHLRQVRHHGDLVTCPLFPRVLEVAVMTASTAPESWSNTATTVIERGATQDEALAGLQTENTTNLSCAARRGREIAEQLTVDWLWPVMCTTNNSNCPQLLSSSSSSSAFDGSPLPSASAGESSPVDASLGIASLSDSATERVDDWAVLVATVTAIAQVRGHMPALRRGNDSRKRAKPAGWSSTGASEERSAAGEETVAYVRNELYVPAMRVLLGMSAQKRSLERNGRRASEASAQKHSLSVDATADLPSWIFLIFAHVVFCFQDCGWLRRSAVHQPATSAHLWCQLYQTVCTAFPHVFAAGKTVTVLWTHLALEGAAAAPSTYHSTFQPFSIGRTEAMQSWIGLLAQSQAGRPLSGKELWQRWSETLEKTHDAEFRNVEGGGALSPRSELRERSAFVASAASCDLEPQRVDFTPGTASEKSVDDVTDQPPLHRPSRHNKLAYEGPLSQHASFASPRPAVAPPMHLHSDAVRGQMRDYLACCTELREEVVSVQVQIFRHYATLPIIVRQETCGGEHGVALATTTSLSVGDIAPDEAARLRRMGRPSFFVLLKLLHSVAAFGDTFVALDKGVTTTTTDAASPSVSGLVPSVMHDALAVCHPVVATYLRRVLVHSTTASGRSGALALLFNETLQSHLNGLPPLLGRRRLVTALLWSGLHPSVLAATPPDEQQQQQQEQRQEQRQVEEEEEEDKTVAFGSGSLAWHVLGSNQQRFFSTLPPLPAPDAGSGGSATHANSSGEDTDTSETMAEPPTTNTPADVSGLVEDVVRHLWQLAVAVPEPARAALHLRPHVCASTDVLNIGSTERAATQEEDQGDGASDTQTQGTPSAASDDDAKGENSCLPGTSADLGMEGVSDNVNIDLGNSDDEGASYDAFADWTPSATDEAEENAEDVSQFVRHSGIDDDATPMENALGEDESDCGEGGVTRWSAQETLQRAVVDGPAALEENSEDHPGQEAKILDQQRASAQKALVAALQSALPASQHLFHSLLEVLAWVANAQQSHEALPTFTELSGESETSGLLRVGSVDWCAELATYYRLCASAWSARVVEAPSTAREPASNEGHATTATITTTKAVDDSVLCRPKLMEQVFLVVSQTCPDVYLLSLLLLNMVVRGTRGPLSSRAVRATLLSRWQRALPLFPSSMECAVAQLLYHAGVSATTVRSWHRDTTAAVGDEHFLESEAILKLVTMHLKLLTSLSANAAHEGGAKPLPSHVATQHDLLLSMGSLLLASLQRRLHSTSRRPPFFSYNFYLNEFLCFSTSPDTDEMSTRKNAPVGVVLPSLQLKSSTPLLRVPQQTTPLRSTWHDGLTATQRAVLRRCCRGDGDKRTSAPRHVKDRANRQKQTVNSVTVEMTASTPQDDNDNYVAAFL